MEIFIAANCQCELGESPVWCEQKQCLYFVDIVKQILYRYHPDNAQLDQFSLPFLTSAITLTEDAEILLLITDQGVWSYAIEQQTLCHQLIAFPERAGVMRTNEAAVSPSGDLFFGTMCCDGSGQHGRWYRFSPVQGQLYCVGPECGIPNTLCWFADHLFFVDTQTALFYQSTDAMQSFTTMTQLTQGNPDGSTISTDGVLWNAMWGDACLINYTGLPDTFSKKQQISLPVKQPTSCAFGGKDLSTLFVTSAAWGLEQRSSDDGNLLSLPTQSKGQLANRFPLSLIMS